MDGPCKPAPGAAPERGEFGGAAARPGCRGALLFGYFLLGTQEKVTRRKGEKITYGIFTSAEAKLGFLIFSVFLLHDSDVVSGSGAIA